MVEIRQRSLNASVAPARIACAMRTINAAMCRMVLVDILVPRTSRSPAALHPGQKIRVVSPSTRPFQCQKGRRSRVLLGGGLLPNAGAVACASKAQCISSDSLGRIIGRCEATLIGLANGAITPTTRSAASSRLREAMIARAKPPPVEVDRRP